jgi:hypothetical protein
MLLWAQAAKEVEVNGVRPSTNVGLAGTSARQADCGLAEPR